MNDQYKQPNYKKAKQKALELLDSFGYKDPYVDPIRICKDLGIKVLFCNFEAEYNNISGFFYPQNNAVYVNKEEYPRRQTFTIAHELGHKLLHEDYIKSSDYQVLFRDSIWQFDNKDWHESEADCFAANLLVPKFMLDRFYKIASIEELSTLFIVSMPVIRNRIKFEYGE